MKFLGKTKKILKDFRGFENVKHFQTFNVMSEIKDF